MISSLTFYTKAHHPTESMSQENENLKRKVYNIIISLYHEACTNPEQENDPVSKKLEPFETYLKSHNRSFSGMEIRKMFMFSSLAVDRNEHDHQIG